MVKFAEKIKKATKEVLAELTKLDNKQLLSEINKHRNGDIATSFMEMGVFKDYSPTTFITWETLSEDINSYEFDLQKGYTELNLWEFEYDQNDLIIASDIINQCNYNWAFSEMITVPQSDWFESAEMDIWSLGVLKPGRYIKRLDSESVVTTKCTVSGRLRVACDIDAADDYVYSMAA